MAGVPLTAQERAVAQVAAFLERKSVAYMIIGGVANIVWGEPRATLAVDVTVWVEDDRLAAVVGDLALGFRSLTGEPLALVRATRVLPLESAEGVRVDVVFGLLPFEREAVARAVAVEMAGSNVRVCTAEDLILMKIISERERDLADAEGIALRRLGVLDLAYLEPRLRELADLLGRAEITQRWEAWKAKAGG